MKNKITFILLFIFTLLTSNVYSQLYIEGVGGVNSLTLNTGHNFVGAVGIGYTNSKVKIGIETGISTGIPYKINTDPSSSGGVSFSDYVDGNDYSTQPKKIITNSGNLYSSSLIVKANQFTFGVNTQWFIIHTFTDKCKWFDISLLSGAGFGLYHDEYSTKYFQPYIKAGLEFDFLVKPVTFFIQTDIRYFAALNGINYQTNSYHSYIQQCNAIGIRYNIEFEKRTDKKQEQPISIHMHSCCNENQIDTIEIPMPITILFANDRYDIRTIEYVKLNSAIQYIKQYQLHVKVVGMASNIGTHNHNQKLSVNRCNTVKNYLIENGVSENLIEIQALGDSKSEVQQQELDRCVILTFE